MALPAALAPPSTSARGTAVARYLNKGSGKMETAQQIHNYRAPAKLPGAHAGKQAAGRRLPASPSKPAPVQLNLGSNSPQEISQIAKQQAQNTLKSTLAPLNAEGKEIQQHEEGASQRFQQDATAGNALLGSVAQQQAASAKTFENQAADSALQAGNAAVANGQNQGSLTAGYVSPELRAQLQAEGNQTSAAGAAGNTFAQGAAQAGSNLSAGIQGASVLRAGEGQDKLTGFFQKQQATVGKSRADAIAKVAADQGTVENDLNQKNYTDRITGQSLGLKATGVQQAQEKIGISKAATGSKIARESAETQQGSEKLSIDAKHYQETDQAAKIRAQAALAKAQKGITTSQQDKFASEIGSAFNTIQTLRTKGVPEGKIASYLNNGYRRVVEEYKNTKGQKAEKAVNEKLSAVKNPTLQKAAFELWKTHTVSKPTQEALGALGISLTAAQLSALVGL